LAADNRFEDSAVLGKFLNSGEDGVFYIGHASALVRLNGKLVLLDPVWNFKPYGDYWTFVPPQVDCSRLLPNWNGDCIVSHIHQDHLCPGIISKLPDVSVMGGRPKLNMALYEARGNDDDFIVIKHQPLVWLPLNEWVEVFFVPHAFNGVDSSCFLRSRKDGYTVYHGNDNFLSDELIAMVRPHVARVDVAMVPYSFVHWYPQCMDMPAGEIAREQSRLSVQSLAQAYSFIEAFCPEVVVPFGNSIFYDDGPNHPLNRSLATPFSLLPGTPFFPGDFVLGSKVVRYPNDEPEYREMLAHYLTRKQPPMDFSPLSGEHTYRTPLFDRVKHASFTVPNHVLIVNGICFDLEHKTVGGDRVAAVKRGDGSWLDITEFKFSNEVFEQWVQGLITFEQAIGTRRFVCHRAPNAYNQKVFEWMNQFL
jgi:L-ascorbate metabolism protein UlaG (beta-lactamase superfamily)